jgi:hypothetical protein
MGSANTGTQLDGRQLAEVCDGFHLSTLFLRKLPDARIGAVVTDGPEAVLCPDGGENVNVTWFTVIGVPLYSVRSSQDVVALAERLEPVPKGGASTAPGAPNVHTPTTHPS